MGYCGPEESSPPVSTQRESMDDRAEAMAAHGRRVGYDQGKRLLKDHGPAEGLLALRFAIEAEEKTQPHDAWGSGYIEGLRDARRESEAKSCLRRLEELHDHHDSRP